MASFNYDAYAAQEALKGTNPNGGLGPTVSFMNEFLKNDGDVAVVRFPYQSMADLLFETTHQVTFPGKRYPSRVRCMAVDCPFCAQGVKVDTRFFVKLLVYVVDETTGQVKALNAVWDRPSAFADIDMKNLMMEYGNISNFLFKIKRNGVGMATRYSINIVMNNTVYNPEIYKADFTELNQVDPIKILSKSVGQYNEALNPGMAQPAQAQPQAAYGNAPQAPQQAFQQAVAQPAVTPQQFVQQAAPQQPVYQAPQQPVYQQPVAPTTTPQPAYQQPVAPTTAPNAPVNNSGTNPAVAPAPATADTEQRRPTTKYQF